MASFALPEGIEHINHNGCHLLQSQGMSFTLKNIKKAQKIILQRRKFQTPPSELSHVLKDLHNEKKWIDAFRAHLQGQDQNLILLDFVIDCQHLLQQPQPENHQEMLKDLYHNYFKPECLKPVPMTNAVRREIICQNLATMSTPRSIALFNLVPMTLHRCIHFTEIQENV